MKKLSIRALLFIAGQEIRRYVNSHRIELECIDEFCDHLEGYATTIDIPAWDDRSSTLAISGYGDPLPEAIASQYPQYYERLDRITQIAREIGASQMYTEGDYTVALHYFYQLFELTESIPQIDDIFYRHIPSTTGWEAPVNYETITVWREISTVQKNIDL
jgi:hypothetical protein